MNQKTFSYYFNRFSIKTFLAFQSSFAYICGGSVCIRCGTYTPCIPLCSECLKYLKDFPPFDENSRCKICGKVLVSELDFCSECKTEPVIKNIDSVFPLHTYRLWKKTLLFAWKMEGDRTLSSVFASIIYKALLLKNFENLVIVPVPPRPRKIRKKGWDQIEELSFMLKKMYGVKIAKLLERVSSKEQKKLNRKERLGSSGAVYKLKEKIKIIPEKVILLDDVVTTGSTLEKCAVLLKSLGVKNVYAFSLFIVD